MRRKVVIQELEDAAKRYQPRGKPWTQEESDILERYYPILPTIEVARYLGRSSDSVHAKAAKMGLKKNKGE